MAEKENQQEAQENAEKGTSIKKEILSTVIYLAIVFCVTFLFVNYVAQRTVVSGHSMNDTLEDGDNLIVNKLTYAFSDPERFDIIVFPYKHKEDIYYIKRIIGLPGEKVQIIDGMIYIDDELLEESYGKEVMNNPGVAAEAVYLGEDEYFVLGDNRNNSSDSRDPSVGLIQKKDIIGKASFRIWPLSKIGFIKHQ